MNILQRMSTGKFVIAAVLVGCFLFIFVRDYIDSPTIKYKLTVYVETPQGLKVGSAVREIHMRTGYALFEGRRLAVPTLYGAAAVVDLGDGRVVFAALNGGANGTGSPDHAKNLLWRVFDDYSGAYTVEGVRFYSRLRKTETTLTIEQYPMVLYYDPQMSSDLMEIYENNYALENGISIKRISIETTGDKASLKEASAWWQKISGGASYVDVYRTGKLDIAPGRRLHKNFFLERRSFIEEE